MGIEGLFGRVTAGIAFPATSCGGGWRTAVAMAARSGKPCPATAAELIETRVRPGGIPEAE